MDETSFLAHGSLLKSNVCLYLFNLCVVSVTYVCYGPCHKSGSPFTGKDFTTQTTLTWKTWNKEQHWLAALFLQLNGLNDVYDPLMRKTITKHFLALWESTTLTRRWVLKRSREVRSQRLQVCLCMQVSDRKQNVLQKGIVPETSLDYPAGNRPQWTSPGDKQTFFSPCEVTFHTSGRKKKIGEEVVFLVTSNHRYQSPPQQDWQGKQYT